MDSQDRVSIYRKVIDAISRNDPAALIVEDVMPAGDERVVGRVTWQGTQQGPFAGLPPTHKPVALAVSHIVRFEVKKSWNGGVSPICLVLFNSLGAGLCWIKPSSAQFWAILWYNGIISEN
jgi:hypothetical protein